MNTKMADRFAGEKSLVTVFEDRETAKSVVTALQNAGFSQDQIEVVTHDVQNEAPELDTPVVHETTGSTMINSATKWGGVGAAIGLVGAVFAPFPGLALGMIFMGGLSGAVVGATAGVSESIDDDTINLPTLKEYEQLVREGCVLVVVVGNHNEVMRAETVLKDFPDIHSHIHSIHGHQFHEHPVL